MQTTQLVLGLASQVYAAETGVQDLQASLMAAQKTTAAHEADSKLWERRALDEKKTNISEINTSSDNNHRNYGHAVINPTEPKTNLTPHHLLSAESQARFQGGCLHDLLANYARLVAALET